MALGRCLQGILTVLLLATAMPALAADPTLGDDILKSANAPNSNQQRMIDEYVRFWSDRLAGSEDEQVMTARRALLEPLNRAPADAFAIAYAGSVVSSIGKTLNNERIPVRLNAMIVFNQVAEAKSASLTQKALSDANPAVRFWAGKVVATLGRRKALKQEDGQALLEAATRAAKAEASPLVLYQMLMGMTEMTGADATRAVLDALNARVQVAAKDSQSPLWAENDALYRVYRRLVDEKANNQLADKAILYDLARVAYRFQALTAYSLDADRTTPDNQRSYISVLNLADDVLRWVYPEIAGKAAEATENIKIAIDSRNWATLRLRADAWKRQLLAVGGQGLTPEGLAVDLNQ